MQDQSLQNTPLPPWPRAIIHMDMDAFFASIEQYDHPELRGKPLAITNGLQGTCIISCSYEVDRCDSNRVMDNVNNRTVNLPSRRRAC